MKLTTLTVKPTFGAVENNFGKHFHRSNCLHRAKSQGFVTSQHLVNGPMVTSYRVGKLLPNSIKIPGYTL